MKFVVLYALLNCNNDKLWNVNVCGIVLCTQQNDKHSRLSVPRVKLKAYGTHAGTHVLLFKFRLLLERAKLIVKPGLGSWHVV